MAHGAGYGLSLGVQDLLRRRQVVALRGLIRLDFAGALTVSFGGDIGAVAAPPPTLEEFTVIRKKINKKKDFKMKKLSPRGKENSTLDVEIPALKPLPKEGVGLMKPREHHRGRRGAIVQRLSPGGQVSDTATDS